MKTVLVVAAHPDDEALGCGGTIIRHVERGDKVYAVFIADGVSSRSGISPEVLTLRNDAAEKARKLLGISKTFFLGLPDNRLDGISILDVIQRLESIIKVVMPNIIYTHHHGDLNIDHRITYQAVLTACRPTPESSIHAIYAFEVISSTEWNSQLENAFFPNHYIEISNYLDAKLKAIEAYSLEMRDKPHSRCIEHVSHLAHHRGYSVGVEAAEAFVTVRTLSI